MKNFIKLSAITFVTLAIFSFVSSAVAQQADPETIVPVVEPTPTIPTVNVLPIGAITENTIVLNAVITSDGGSPVLSAGFMWGTDLYTNSIATPNNIQGDNTFQETVTGLACATTYNYEPFAISAVGTGLLGGGVSFTTADCSPTPRAPYVEILQTPTNISTTSVTLIGLVKYLGTTSVTEAGFHWGTDVNYGNTFSSTTVFETHDELVKTITGLNCETTYHYNFYATNSIGTGTTSDSTFVTDACPEVVPNTGPTAGGSNGNDADSTIIPTAGGSNANDANPIIIPTAGGSNDNGSSTTPDTIITINPERSSGGSSSSGVSTGSRFIAGNFNVSNSAGDTASSCVVIATTLRKGSTGLEVRKLQELLNKLGIAKLAISGNYDDATVQAVKDFQNRYASEILAPWGVTDPSGIVSFTTLKKINELSCGQDFPLSSVEEYLINQYKINPQVISSESTTTPLVAPIEVGVDTTTTQQNSDQTAGAANTEVSDGIFQKIINFFKNIF